MPSIYAKDLLAFLESNEPALYKKYKEYNDSKFNQMKEPRYPAQQKEVIKLITKMGIHEGYQHGDVIEFMDEGMRGRELYYWDALKEKPIYPSFDHGDATLPEIFLIGDGFFSPDHWGEEYDWHPKRPCKALTKELKTHISKTDEPTKVTINGKKYRVQKTEGDWDNYNWNKMMLITEDPKTLLVDSGYEAEGKGTVNEEKLRAIMSGDNTKRQQTRKLDLAAKLKAAEKKLMDAHADVERWIQEVDRLRKELDAFGKRGTRRA